MKVLYTTGNSKKFENAKYFFAKHDIEIEQLLVDINEIQSDDALSVTIDKALKAYELEKKSLFVNDATWIIPALRGFPGPFMKYINKWFDPIDFVHLMQGKNDRRIILRDYIVFIDCKGHKVFKHDYEGIILDTVAPFDYNYPTDVVISLSKDKKSIAEKNKEGSFFIEGENKIWEEFAQWLMLEKL